MAGRSRAVRQKGNRMKDLSLFLKKNKIKKENAFYPAASDLKDENGEVLLWEIKALSTKEIDELRIACTKEVPVNAAKGLYRTVFDNRFGAKLCAAAVVYPDLYNAELQDSYGVKSPEELLLQMIDNPGEFNAFAEFVREHSGIKNGLAESVQEAKN